MILSTLVTSQLHFETCAGLYGHPVYSALARSQGHETRFHQQLFPSGCIHLTVGLYWESEVNVSGNRTLL